MATNTDVIVTFHKQDDEGFTKLTFVCPTEKAGDLIYDITRYHNKNKNDFCAIDIIPAESRHVTLVCTAKYPNTVLSDLNLL